MRRFWFILFIYSIGSAEEKADSLGNKLPLTPNRNIAFETSEGTWMSLDVSPGGRSIICLVTAAVQKTYGLQMQTVGIQSN